MEFQAIVLAGGKGSRMSELTTNTPKCLLPIGTKPMIWYPVRMLEKAGFNDIIIITLESIKSRVEAELKINHGIRANLIMCGIDDSSGEEANEYAGGSVGADIDDEFGTGSALKMVKDKIVKDCMIVSCDLITNLNIQQMASFYRLNNASFVALLADSVEQSCELPVPGSKGKFAPECDIIALDGETNRILYFDSQDDVEDIKIKYRIFQKYPKLTMTSKLLDGHFYIIKKSLIDYIVDNKKFISIKSDFLPHVCKKQFSSNRKKSHHEQQQKPTIIDYLTRESNSSSHHTKKQSSEEILSCYAFILADGFCYRANNVAIYAEANRQVLAKLIHYYQRDKTDNLGGKIQVGSDNIINEGTTVGDKCVIKRSVLGKNCKIGDKARITNSILMDNVTVEEGVVIQGSVVCADSTIHAKTEFKDCLIGYEQDLTTTGKYSNETIVDVDSFIDD